MSFSQLQFFSPFSDGAAQVISSTSEMNSGRNHLWCFFVLFFVLVGGEEELASEVKRRIGLPQTDNGKVRRVVWKQ